VHAVLDRHGLVNHDRRRRHKAQGTALSKPTRPNDLWCADYKGEFMKCYQMFRNSENGMSKNITP